MFIIVGDSDTRDDRRWVWDGATAMRYLASPQEHTDLINRAAVGLITMHPLFSSLDVPFWMSTAERATYGAA